MRCCRPVGVKVGVLALQGDVSEHIAAFRQALADRPGSMVIPVRHTEDLAGLDALAIPGGESTTISRLIEKNGLYEPLAEFEGGVFATCAGMVLAADRVDDPRVRTLNLISMHVTRNAFGRQVDSREACLEIAGLTEPARRYSPASRRGSWRSGTAGIWRSPSTRSSAGTYACTGCFLRGSGYKAPVFRHFYLPALPMNRRAHASPSVVSR